MAINIPKLNITQVPNKIGINIKEPEYEINQTKPETSIEKGKGKQQISQKNARVNVDNYPARYDLGYRNYKDFMKDFAQEGKQSMLSQIKKYANQGDQLMRIENGGKPIISQAKQENKPSQKEIALRWKRGPKISVRENSLDINYSPQKVKSNLSRGEVSSNLNWGKVSTYLEQKADLEINVRGNNLNRLS